MLQRATTTLMLLSLVACGPDYSPDTYATNAVQQANKVEQGVVIGVRDVAVSANGTLGTVAGGAAGGIAGSQVGVGPLNAFTALGGTLVGGITGSAIEHASGDTKAFEYIVRKTGNDLVSVTQKDKLPLALGQHVLVIGGNQARLVPDYTVTLTPDEKAKAAQAATADLGPAASVRPSQPNAFNAAATPVSTDPVMNVPGSATPATVATSGTQQAAVVAPLQPVPTADRPAQAEPGPGQEAATPSQ